MSTPRYIYGMIEGGLVQLVSTAEEIALNRHSASVAVTLANGPLSGEILSIALYSSGPSPALLPDLSLYIFDEDPAMLVNTSTLPVGAIATVVGAVSVASADWVGDADNKTCLKSVSIPFHAVSSLYFVFRNLGAGDVLDSLFRLNFWYRRES